MQSLLAFSRKQYCSEQVVAYRLSRKFHALCEHEKRRAAASNPSTPQAADEKSQLPRIGSSPQTASPHALTSFDLACHIYDQYMRSGAPEEIDVPLSVRSAVESALDAEKAKRKEIAEVHAAAVAAAAAAAVATPDGTSAPVIPIPAPPIAVLDSGLFFEFERRLLQMVRVSLWDAFITHLSVESQNKRFSAACDQTMWRLHISSGALLSTSNSTSQSSSTSAAPDASSTTSTATPPVSKITQFDYKVRNHPIDAMFARCTGCAVSLGSASRFYCRHCCNVFCFTCVPRTCRPPTEVSSASKPIRVCEWCRVRLLSKWSMSKLPESTVPLPMFGFSITFAPSRHSSSHLVWQLYASSAELCERWVDTLRRASEIVSKSAIDRVQLDAIHLESMVLRLDPASGHLKPRYLYLKGSHLRMYELRPSRVVDMDAFDIDTNREHHQQPVSSLTASLQAGSRRRSFAEHVKPFLVRLDDSSVLRSTAGQPLPTEADDDDGLADFEPTITAQQDRPGQSSDDPTASSFGYRWTLVDLKSSSALLTGACDSSRSRNSLRTAINSIGNRDPITGASNSAKRISLPGHATVALVNLRNSNHNSNSHS